MLPFTNSVKILSEIEQEKQDKINQNVLQSVEYLKFCGLHETIASQIMNGKIYCTDSNGLLQYDTNIFEQYVNPNVAQPREITELEGKILVSIPELCRFDVESGEWKNINQNFYGDFPMFCINTETKNGKRLSVLRYGETRRLEVEREFMDGKSLTITATTVDIEKFISRQDKSNLWYYNETIVVWFDNGRIIRII